MPLYDIVKAEHDQADVIAASEAPLSLFSGFDCRPIDNIKLAVLFELVGLAHFDAAIDVLEPVASGMDDGPFVSLLPPELLDAISSLGASRLDAIADAWSGSEEFALDGIGAGEAREFLTSLAGLWKQAKDADHSLFLWAVP